jgi:hypothetical protein
MPVILAEEDEIGKIVVPGPLQQKIKKVCETPHLHGKKLGEVVGPCCLSYSWKQKIGR